MGLDAVDLVMAIEDEFSINLSDENASRLETVGDLHQAVLQRLQEKGAVESPISSSTSDDVWQIVQYLVAEQLGMKTAWIEKSTRFIEDLHIN